jgi:hypothetical protein
VSDLPFYWLDVLEDASGKMLEADISGRACFELRLKN